MISKKAKAAIRAARNIENWGSSAARKYAGNQGVKPGVYRVARECEILCGLGSACTIYPTI